MEKSAGGPAVALRVLDLNAELLGAAATRETTTVEYASASRVFALLDQAPDFIEVNGRPYTAATRVNAEGCVVELPGGKRVTVRLGKRPTGRP